MKGKIDKRGVLQIYRGNYYNLQNCPIISDSNDACLCGDNCPLFGEPVPTKEKKGVWLSLCRKELHFTEFKDEREVK